MSYYCIVVTTVVFSVQLLECNEVFLTLNDKNWRAGMRL